MSFGEIESDALLDLLLNRQIFDKAIHCGKPGIIRLRNFNLQFLMQANNKVQQIHRIDIQLIAESEIGLNLRHIGFRSNLANDDS